MKARETLLISLFIVGFTCIAQNESNYGNTPEKIRPYRNFEDPYVDFFAEPQEFLGTGRNKKAPADLKAVRIGFLGPLEGSRDAEMGQQMLNGTLLAIEEANRSGGYRGLPFELMLHNDVGLWGAAANEIVRMDEEGVWGIIGSIDGTVTHVALRVALKVEIPMVNTGDSDPTLTETRIPWIIRVLGDDRQSGYALADYMINERGHSKIAILRINNRYGRVGSAEFKDASRRFGFPIVMEMRFSEGDTSYTSQLNRIRQSGADALLIWADKSEDGIRIIQEMNQLGMDLPIYTCDRMITPEFLKSGELVEGIVSTHPYNPESGNTGLIQFQSAYKERFGIEPDMFATHAYDGTQILLKAIEIAGLNRALIRDVLTDLKTFQGYPGITGEIIFDPTWNDIGRIWMVEVKEGSYRYFDPPQSYLKGSQ